MITELTQNQRWILRMVSLGRVSQSAIQMATIREGLNLLERNGLITWHSSTNKYRLTIEGSKVLNNK
jgi:DNA-binding IclR family transcriptional regulator